MRSYNKKQCVFLTSERHTSSSVKGHKARTVEDTSKLSSRVVVELQGVRTADWVSTPYTALHLVLKQVYKSATENYAHLR